MNYFPSPTIANIQAGVALPTYLAGNVATFGSLSLGRSVKSYERAIVRLKAKIKNLKKKRRMTKRKARKKIITKKIVNARKKLQKLQGYLAIKKAHKAKKGKGSFEPEPIFDDEILLLEEAEAIDPDEMMDYQEMDEQLFATEGEVEDGGMVKLLIGGGLLLGGLFIVSQMLGKKPRSNRVKLGKKSNPKRRKRRKSRKKRR